MDKMAIIGMMQMEKTNLTRTNKQQTTILIRLVQGLLKTTFSQTMTLSELLTTLDLQVMILELRQVQCNRRTTLCRMHQRVKIRGLKVEMIHLTTGISTRT